MSGRLRVGIFAGGRSAEHEVSVASAESVLRAIDRERLRAVPGLHRSRGPLAPAGRAGAGAWRRGLAGLLGVDTPAEHTAHLRSHEPHAAGRRRSSRRAGAARRAALAGRGDRRRLPGPARPVRRGRHAAGLPGAGRHPVHRGRRAGQRGGHGQDRLQGPDARPWPAGGRLHLVPPRRLDRCAGRTCWREVARAHRSTVGRQARPAGQQPGHDAGARRRRAAGGARRGAPLRQQGHRRGATWRMRASSSAGCSATTSRSSSSRARCAATPSGTTTRRSTPRAWPTSSRARTSSPTLAARLQGAGAGRLPRGRLRRLRARRLPGARRRRLHQRDEHHPRLHRHEHVPEAGRAGRARLRRADRSADRAGPRAGPMKLEPASRRRGHDASPEPAAAAARRRKPRGAGRRPGTPLRRRSARGCRRSGAARRARRRRRAAGLVALAQRAVAARHGSVAWAGERYTPRRASCARDRGRHRGTTAAGRRHATRCAIGWRLPAVADAHGRARPARRAARSPSSREAGLRLAHARRPRCSAPRTARSSPSCRCERACRRARRAAAHRRRALRGAPDDGRRRRCRPTLLRVALRLAALDPGRSARGAERLDRAARRRVRLRDRVGAARLGGGAGLLRARSARGSAAAPTHGWSSSWRPSGPCSPPAPEAEIVAGCPQPGEGILPP